MSTPSGYFTDKNRKIRPITPTISSFFGASVSDVENAARRDLLRRQDSAKRQRRIIKTGVDPHSVGRDSLNSYIEAAKVSSLDDMLNPGGLRPGERQRLERRQKKWENFRLEQMYYKMGHPDVTDEELHERFKIAYKQIEGVEYVPKRGAVVTTYYNDGTSKTRYLEGEEYDKYQQKVKEEQEAYRKALSEKKKKEEEQAWIKPSDKRISDGEPSRPKYKNISIFSGNEKYF